MDLCHNKFQQNELPVVSWFRRLCCTFLRSTEIAPESNGENHLYWMWMVSWEDMEKPNINLPYVLSTTLSPTMIGKKTCLGTAILPTSKIPGGRVIHYCWMMKHDVYVMHVYVQHTGYHMYRYRSSSIYAYICVCGKHTCIDTHMYMMFPPGCNQVRHPNQNRQWLD